MSSTHATLMHRTAANPHSAAAATAINRPPAVTQLRAQRRAAPVCVAMMPPQRRTAVLVAASATRNPSGGYQQPLSNSERKSKRGEAQRLGRELVTVNLGKNGLTPAFLDGFRTALTSNELIKASACPPACLPACSSLLLAGLVLAPGLHDTLRLRTWNPTITRTALRCLCLLATGQTICPPA